jgi:hypothetical protein
VGATIAAGVGWDVAERVRVVPFPHDIRGGLKRMRGLLAPPTVCTSLTIGRDRPPVTVVYRT